MKYSKLFVKTSKQAPTDADSPNARLLLQAGIVDQLSAGVYTYLPFGLRVMDKINAIVREEMNAIDGVEVLMPTLVSKKYYDQTGRWDVDVAFKTEGSGDKEYALGWSHEDVLTPIVKKFANSYKDFPIAIYQIQNKFRNEVRAKSGVLRGREFLMKDLYSFHLSEESFWEYYEKSKGAYLNVFKRCGLNAILTEAAGGAFTSSITHEFQVPTEFGEDIIYVDEERDIAWNKEVAEGVEDGGDAPDGKGKVKEMKSIEVGNIFPLGTRYADAINYEVLNDKGEKTKVIMGSYGIGISRLMGSIVEVHHDDRGIIWPKSVAPFSIHLISLNSKDKAQNETILNKAEALYQEWTDAGVDVFWDEREGVSAGAKFADADLMGMPLRLVISEKTLSEQSIEWKERSSDDARLVKLDSITKEVETYLNE